MMLCGVGSSQPTILVPLSGYETRQEYTYTPNITGTAVPYSNLIPAAFRRTSADFTPHTFNIGDPFESDSNLTVFKYTIVTAYTRKDVAGSSAPRAVANEPSFVYRNYDFSTCDVVAILLWIPFVTSLGSPSAIVS
jgi:hypothetical protein